LILHRVHETRIKARVEYEIKNAGPDLISMIRTRLPESPAKIAPLWRKPGTGLWSCLPQGALGCGGKRGDCFSLRGMKLKPYYEGVPSFFFRSHVRVQVCQLFFLGGATDGYMVISPPVFDGTSVLHVSLKHSASMTLQRPARASAHSAPASLLMRSLETSLARPRCARSSVKCA